MSAHDRQRCACRFWPTHDLYELGVRTAGGDSDRLGQLGLAAWLGYLQASAEGSD